MTIASAVFQGREAIERSWGDELNGDARLLEIFEKCARKAAGEETGVIGWVKWTWNAARWGAGYGKDEVSVAQRVSEYYAKYQERLGVLREQNLPIEKLSDEAAMCGVHGFVTSEGNFLVEAIVQRGSFVSDREISGLFGRFVDALSFDAWIDIFAAFDEETDLGRYGKFWFLNWISGRPTIIPKSEKFTEKRFERMMEFFTTRLDEAAKPTVMIEFLFANHLFKTFFTDDEQVLFRAFVNKQMRDIPAEQWPNKLDLATAIMQTYPGWEGLELALSNSQDTASRSHADSIVDQHFQNLYGSHCVDSLRMSSLVHHE